MNKTNDKGVREGVWVTDGVNCCGSCFYDGVPVFDPVFRFQQSHMQGKWERRWKFEYSFEVGFMNKSVLNGEYIYMLL